MQYKRLLSTFWSGFSIVLGLGVLVLIVAWLSGAFHEKIQPGEATTIATFAGNQATDVVHEVVKDYVEETIGTLKASSRSVVSAKVLATIEEITVTAGDSVNTGDVLVKLESEEFKSRVLQARDALAAARATRIEGELAFERAKKLLASRAVSQQEYDTLLRTLDVSKAEERRATQAVVETEVKLSYTTIVAPKSGRIIDRLAEPGDTSRPGEPLLVLYDASSLRLEAPVLEHLAVKLQVGEQVSVYIDSLQKEFPATIDEIVPQADALSRSFLIKASLPQSDRLFEGMFGRLRISAGSRRHLCLATDAIQHMGQLEFVEVLLPSNVVERRLIKTGRLGMPGRVEVLSGVRANERVVLRTSNLTSPAKNSDEGDHEPITD